MKRILFLAHDAHLAGAQLLLLQFLQYIKRYHPDIDYKLIVGNEGVLLGEFKKLTQVFVFYPQQPNTLIIIN